MFWGAKAGTLTPMKHQLMQVGLRWCVLLPTVATSWAVEMDAEVVGLGLALGLGPRV